MSISNECIHLSCDQCLHHDQFHAPETFWWSIYATVFFWKKYATMFKTNLIVVIYINIYFAIVTNSELGKKLLFERVIF